LFDKPSAGVSSGSCRIKVNMNLDERKLTGAVFLDAAKAFDTV
jgi:hypothetical protein